MSISRKDYRFLAATLKSERNMAHELPTTQRDLLLDCIQRIEDDLIYTFQKNSRAFKKQTFKDAAESSPGASRVTHTQRKGKV